MSMCPCADGRTNNRFYELTHHFCHAEAGHADPSGVMTVQVKTVERHQQPQVDAWYPHQHRVLETLGQVRVGCVPGPIPVLPDKEKYSGYDYEFKQAEAGIKEIKSLFGVGGNLLSGTKQTLIENCLL